MPPSVDSTWTQSACVTRSTPRKRNSCSSKVNQTEHLRKKSRGPSPHSETSPRRPRENRDRMGQLTQESQKKMSGPENIDSYVHVDPPHRLQQQKNDGFLRRAKFGKEGRRAREGVDGCIRSLILQSGNLARSILAAYEKEKDVVIRENCTILTELAQLRSFQESATKELAQVRTSNEAAAAEVASLQLENETLRKKETFTSSKLNEFQRQCATRDAVNIIAAFIMSKALMLKDVAELNGSVSFETDRLRFENAQIIKELTEIEAKGRSHILNLQSSLAASSKEIVKLGSEKAELAKEMDDREAAATSATRDLLCRLAAANEETTQVQTKTEALLREKDEAAARAAYAAAVELDEMKSRNESLLREMQTVITMTGAEMEKMHSTIESTTDNLRKLFQEKEEFSREKAKSEARTKMEIAQLLSEKAALLAEKEKTSATVAREFKNLGSRFEATVETLETVRKATGLEKAMLQAEVAAKISELEGLKKKGVEVQANMASKEARAATEIHRLRREKEESQAREIALLEKLQSMKVSPAARSEMHVAFLINCGLLRPDEHNFSFT